MRFTNALYSYLVILYLFIAMGGDCSVLPDTNTQHLVSDTAEHGEPIVDSIIIDNRNIFNTDSSAYSHWIFKLANKLHYKTRVWVIKDEILFKPNEPYPPELVEETTRNLRNRLQLYDAWTEVDTLPNGHVNVRVVTVDEWTLSAGPNFTRDGNENRYEFAVTERNLLGRNQYLSVRYVIQDNEDNYIDGVFRDRRFWGEPYQVDMQYNNNPLNDIRSVGLSHPFYNLTQNTSYGLNIMTVKRRNDIYNNTDLIGQYRTKGDNFYSWLDIRTGSYRQKAQLSMNYKYVYKETYDKLILSDIADDSTLVTSTFPTDSVYHQFGVGIKVFDLNFKKLRQIDGIGYTEDFVFGHTAGLSIARAFNPNFKNRVYDKLSVLFSQGFNFSNNLIYWSYQRDIWFHGESDLRQTAELSAYYYNYSMKFLTLSFKGSYSSDWWADGGESLILGGKTGLRGYEKFFRTGDRRMTMNLEARFFPSLPILSVVFSPVLFMDAGKVLRRDESFSMKDFYFSGGAGLRIGVGHSSRNRLTRIDVAYSKHSGWEISVGTDQYFNSRKASFFLTTR